MNDATPFNLKDDVYISALQAKITFLSLFRFQSLENQCKSRMVQVKSGICMGGRGFETWLVKVGLLKLSFINEKSK